jgi:hypothetical protein
LGELISEVIRRATERRNQLNRRLTLCSGTSGDRTAIPFEEKLPQQ